MTHIIGFGP